MDKKKPLERTIETACPTCGQMFKSIGNENPIFPFCTERCKLIDLGVWLEGGYVISTPLQQFEDENQEST